MSLQSHVEHFFVVYSLYFYFFEILSWVGIARNLEILVVEPTT